MKRCAYYFLDSGYDVSGWRWFNCFFPLYPLGWNYETVDYDYDTVTREIDAGRPVYLQGQSGYLEFWTAHIWVADGYKKGCYVSRYREEIGRYTGGVFNKIRDRYYEYESGGDVKMINMNWGWGNGTSWVTYNYWRKVGNHRYRYERNRGMMTVKLR